MAQLSPIYGLLSVMPAFPPSQTQAYMGMSEGLNAAAGEYAHIFNALLDWGYNPYRNIYNPLIQMKRDKTPCIFKSGDLVKVFSTANEGRVLWDGEIKFQYDEYHHGLQENMNKRQWVGMCMMNLPAKLECDGEIIHGALQAHEETGTEGPVWAVYQYGILGYDSLHILKSGDQLTVYDEVTNGDIEWEGKVSFGKEGRYTFDLTDVLRKTNHVSTPQWLQWTLENRPVIVRPMVRTYK